MLRAAVLSAALMGSAVAAPVNVSHFIDNPSDACSTCSFHPQERADAITAESESGEFKGKVSFRIHGYQADMSHEKITSGNVKVTLYEVGVQHKVAEHSFDYWTCPRAPADCDACVGTYETGEFIKFDDAEPCRNQKKFTMDFTLSAPVAMASGHFTLAIIAQPANAQHTGGGLNAVWELQMYGPVTRESLPGVPTPTFVLPEVPTFVLPGVPAPASADKPRLSLRGAASDFENAMVNGDDDAGMPSGECAVNPGYGECWGTFSDGVNKCAKYEAPGKDLCDCIGGVQRKWEDCLERLGCYSGFEKDQCEQFQDQMSGPGMGPYSCAQWPDALPTC